MKTLIPSDLMWLIAMCYALVACWPIGLAVGCVWAVWRGGAN